MTATRDQELIFAGPADLAEQVRARAIHPRELVELCLRRIEALDPRLNAFRTVMAEEALAEADALKDPGNLPLAGVPIAVKDSMALKGQPTTLGSRSHPPPASEDAEPVRRLRAAGAIPVGVTNVPELTIFPWTATAANGITRNPWNLERTPGGSSGGSAAAVAAGMVPAATGSDGAGSIRIPSACCGLVGMKPSRGRVSSQPAGEGWLGLSVIGALARTVRDSALMLDVMQGTLPADVDRLPGPETSFLEAAERPPGRLRIAVSRKLPRGLVARVSPDQRLAFDRTTRLLDELGHEVSERTPDYGTIGVHLIRTYTRGIYEDSLEVPDRGLLEASTRQMARAGRTLVPDSRRERLLAARPAHIRRMLQLWEEVDVLLTPALARTALPAEGGYGRSAPRALDLAARFTPWTGAFNVTGQPALSLPTGLGADGLPTAVQLVGRPGDEGLLYSLGAQLEAAQPWATLRPPHS